eukprot:TRINITY_DN9220_c0_g1_i2.p1 TRINITY_DN9220_c0_g1~~TRINITY_DN9220_c0_g1_i2.p1  ORF type:complete len:818 (-),score=137.95 TRINITY_DN9220_c0_g1_i2:81-2480(-)
MASVLIEDLKTLLNEQLQTLASRVEATVQSEVRGLAATIRKDKRDYGDWSVGNVPKDRYPTRHSMESADAGPRCPRSRSTELIDATPKCPRSRSTELVDATPKCPRSRSTEIIDATPKRPRSRSTESVDGKPRNDNGIVAPCDGDHEEDGRGCLEAADEDEWEGLASDEAEEEEFAHRAPHRGNRASVVQMPGLTGRDGLLSYSKESGWHVLPAGAKHQPPKPIDFALDSEARPVWMELTMETTTESQWEERDNLLNPLVKHRKPLAPHMGDSMPTEVGKDCMGVLTSAVRNNAAFEQVTMVVVLINAIGIGVETDYMARNMVDSVPSAFLIVDAVFALLFTLEVLARLVACGKAYFEEMGFSWGVFIIVNAVIQISELVVKFTTTGDSWLRSVILTLRFVRIFRLLDGAHAIDEVRYLAVSIHSSMRSLCSSLVVIFLVTYVCSLPLTQIVLEYAMSHPDEEAAIKDLRTYYGTLDRSMIALFQTISDGVHWRQILDPLTEHCSMWLELGFVFYIGFTIFAMTNILTGVFCESAMKTAEDDKRRTVTRQIRRLFEEADDDKNGLVCWNEFSNVLEVSDQMEDYLRSLDIRPEQARQLFFLLDTDGSGEIDYDEFTQGCSRFSGSLKAIDFAAFMIEWRAWKEDQEMRRPVCRLPRDRADVDDQRSLPESEEGRRLRKTSGASAEGFNRQAHNATGASLESSHRQSIATGAKAASFHRQASGASAAGFSRQTSNVTGASATSVTRRLSSLESDYFTQGAMKVCESSTVGPGRKEGSNSSGDATGRSAQASSGANLRRSL